MPGLEVGGLTGGEGGAASTEDPDCPAACVSLIYLMVLDVLNVLDKCFVGAFKSRSLAVAKNTKSFCL